MFCNFRLFFMTNVSCVKARRHASYDFTNSTKVLDGEVRLT